MERLKSFTPSIRNKKFFKYLFIIIGFFIPAYLSISIVVSGNIPFWYDSARDLSAAVANLKKISLIGQTTGIPGLFYGPYWIWLLSLGISVSKDPRIILLLVITIPYLVIFPILLIKIFGYINGIILWLVFFFSTGVYYMTHLWNPVVAPLLLLFIIFIAAKLLEFKRNSYLMVILTGILTGVLMQFHMSLGFGIFIGNIFLIFLIFVNSNFKFSKKAIAWSKFNNFFVYFIGFLLSFLPFLVFELRHNFMQLNSIFEVFISQEKVIGITGISKNEIIQTFFGRLEVLLKQPLWLIGTAFLSLTYYKLLKDKWNIFSFRKKLHIYLLSLLFTILSVYLTAKNPVWGYHFTGIEVIFLVLLGLYIDKFNVARIILILVLLLSASAYLREYMYSVQSNPLSHGSLYTKKYITQMILKDSKNENITVFAYSPSIYVFEYSYLFNWLGNMNVPYDPSLNPTESQLVYLILPPTQNSSAVEDFINYRTPNSKYKTGEIFEIPDGTKILKRIRNE